MASGHEHGTANMAVVAVVLLFVLRRVGRNSVFSIAIRFGPWIGSPVSPA